MSVEEKPIDLVFKDVNIALKNLWEAVLLDHESKPLDWTKPLITSITTPRLKLIVSATDGGAHKSYMGYELPDGLSLTLYETIDRRVEKYLDSWMFGENGVFNKETGQFRTRSSSEKTNIYRGVRFVTTSWENDTTGTDANVQLQENFTEIQQIIINQVQKIAGRNLNIVEKQEIGFFANQMLENPVVKQAKIMKVQQIAPQLTAIAAQAANQVLGIVPGMFMPRVVIPPPLLKVPAMVPSPIIPKIYTNLNRANVTPSERRNSITLREVKNPQTGSSKQILPEGSKVKTYKHKGKVISTTTYTCAIESYDPASYDYESGGPISYTVNLSVLNYKTEYS